jgi:hypothetical protein
MISIDCTSHLTNPFQIKRAYNEAIEQVVNFRRKHNDFAKLDSKQVVVRLFSPIFSLVRLRRT